MSFEVICIKAPVTCDHDGSFPPLKVGDKYNVVGTTRAYGDIFYYLEGLVEEGAYNSKLFGIVDDNFGQQVAEQIEKTFIKPLIPVEYE